MRYYPVKIQRRFAQVFDKAGNFIRQTKDYFVVTSNLLGDCGHQHRTESGAKPCYDKMSKEWSARRSAQSRENAAKRKAAAA